MAKSSGIEITKYVHYQSCDVSICQIILGRRGGAGK
jgi:hypothetical protein